MKREAFRHPKTFDLAARLGLPNAYAFSHVAYLFNATADIAPQGNIGKWPNGVIARNSEWTGDPDTFVQAMISAGWLDAHPHNSVRLLIHDWPDHAERFVKAKLSRERVWFHWAYYASGERAWDAPDGLQLVLPDDYCTPCKTTGGTTEPTVDSSPPCDQTNPIQSQPIPTQPNRRRASKAYLPAFEAWYQSYPRHVGKDDAAAAFGRAVGRIAAVRNSDETSAEAWLLEITRTFAASPAGKSSREPGDLHYVPYPATWLNGGRYNDDPTEWTRSNGNGTGNHKQPAHVGPGQRYRGD